MEEKKSHPCSFKWAESNLPHMSVVMILTTHIWNNIHKLEVNRSVSLFANPETSNNAIFYDARAEGYTHLEGCYLYYDKENGKWIRSGKAGGDGSSNFGNCDKEHAQSAKKATASLFYSSYPDECTTSILAKGSRQDLSQYYGLSFDGKDSAKITHAENDLLKWDVLMMEWVHRTSKDKRKVEHTPLSMVAYLIELAYELSIGSDDNISESEDLRLL